MQMILGNEFSDLEFEVKVKGQIMYFPEIHFLLNH